MPRKKKAKIEKQNADPRKKNTTQKQNKLPPSKEALDFSAKLQEFSKTKDLKNAISLYWNPQYDSIRDGYHGTIMIDCCSRCGSIEEGEKVIQEMTKQKIEIPVQANTALLKGYVHSGMIEKALDLYSNMCNLKYKNGLPNVRSFNTLLRGCLWNATTFAQTTVNIQRPKLIGGVLSAEYLWKLSTNSLKLNFDLSSYEYYIQSLCYALRVSDAEDHVKLMREKKVMLAGSNSRDFNESLCLCLVALARAYALLGNNKKAKKNASMVVEILAEDEKDVVLESKMESDQSIKIQTIGGKRSYHNATEDRIKSNETFRKHRLSELKLEADSILSFSQSSTIFSREKSLLPHLFTRLLYFSGGGTTQLSTQEKRSLDKEIEYSRGILAQSLWHSFGLSQAVGSMLGVKMTSYDHGSLLKTLKSDIFREVLSDDGYIDFSKVFRPITNNHEEHCENNKGNDSINIELGAGSGDWIVRQAKENPDINYVACELRADRVAQIFSKIALNKHDDTTPLTNVCCVGAECGSFLSQRIRRKSVSRIFVNFPEPPTQTYGSKHDFTLESIVNNEPAHMLHSSTIFSAAECLLPNGEIMIVTDNRWYGRLICTTMLKVLGQRPGLLEQKDMKNLTNLRPIQSFSDDSVGNRVTLYVGQSSDVINGNEAVSYFDKLWRAGGGKHSDSRDRFIICMVRSNSLTSRSSNNDRTSSRKSYIGNHTKPPSGKKNKKRSKEKQALRNMRRLEKKKIVAS